MKISIRFVSYLLIIFSLLGYALSIQIFYVSVHVRTASTWLEDAPTQLELIKETIDEASNGLQRAKFLLSKETFLNTTSELAQNLRLILTNETIDETLSSANKTFYEVIAKLDKISNLTSPQIAKEIKVATDSIRALAEKFSTFTLFINSTRQSITNIINSALDDLEDLRAYIKEIQAKIEDWGNYLNRTSINIDTWISRTKIMREYLRNTEYFLYTLIIYLIGLNTTLLLTGIVFKKLQSHGV